ncbi:MAG: hypothetical protein HW385_1134, partial [candidate division NC10 bacterium]|nr:hypothetical protein [candidate division NC10 bacterium]
MKRSLRLGSIVAPTLVGLLLA